MPEADWCDDPEPTYATCPVADGRFLNGVDALQNRTAANYPPERQESLLDAILLGSITDKMAAEYLDSLASDEAKIKNHGVGILCQVLRQCGFPETVNAFERLDWWR